MADRPLMAIYWNTPKTAAEPDGLVYMYYAEEVPLPIKKSSVVSA